MVFRSSIPLKQYPKVSLFEFLFEHHVPYDESNKKIFVDALDEKNFFTFNDVKNNVLCVTAGLVNTFDLQREDVVAICSPNEMLYPIILHGVVAAGGITATVDHTLLAESLATDFDLLQPKVLVTHEDVLDKVLEAVKISNINIDESRILIFGDRNLKGVRTVQEVLLGHGNIGAPVKYQPDELSTTVAYLYFTSGSTGLRKAVMLTHASMIASITFQEDMPLTSDDVSLAYTGYQHTSALWTTMHVSIYYGIETVNLSPFSLEAFCEAIQKFKISFSLIQPWIVSSLDREPIVKQYDISSLKKVICGGAASEKTVMQSFYKNNDVVSYNAYALTEAVGIFDITAETSLQGGVGKPARGVTAKLVNDDGIEVGEGEQGELYVKSPTLMLGYYKNQRATNKAIDSEGYFHTGDIFTVDKEGVFHYVDRKKNLIKYFLHHIHPQTIENILLSHPKVTDCGATGVFSKELVTELIRVYVKLVDGEEENVQTAQELKSFVEEQVEDAMRLRGGIYVVKSLPRTASGKVNRLKLTAIDQENIAAFA